MGTQGNVLGQTGLFKVTFNTIPANATVIVKDEKGDIVQPITDKTYKLKMKKYSYSVSCEGYFSKENENLAVVKSQVVNVNLDKILYVEFILFPTDATLVVKDGSGAILTPETGNIYKVKAGMYSYSVTAEKYKPIENVSFEMTNTEGNKDINVTLQDARIFGVRRQLSNTSTAWERINDSVGLVANAVHVHPNDILSVQNDFNKISPWKDIKTCDISADGTINAYITDASYDAYNPIGYIMTEFPEFWWQRKQENEYEYIYISNIEQEGFTKSKKFYLARYTSSSSTELDSRKGVRPTNVGSITDFRTGAKKIGNNWGIMDILRWAILQMLYLVEYADYDSQKTLGYGACDSNNIWYNGAGLANMYSGAYPNTKNQPVIYRGIENIFGNIYQWVDGINISEFTAYISYNPSDYVSDKFDYPYIKLGYGLPGASGYIKTIGYDANNPAIQLPKLGGGSDSTYIPDYVASVFDDYIALKVGGDYESDLMCGLWCFNAANYSSTTNGVGRLLFIPK